MSENAKLIVGLTGGIASGKSTVGRLLAEAGFTVTDADRTVASLYEAGQPGARAVAELFGDEVLDESGAVDRPALAAKVFADEDARRKLEKAIHPLVGQRSAEIVAAHDGVLIFEATLLVETGGARNYPLLITVEADDAVRLERAVERGHSREDAEARLQAQATSAQRRAAADIVIENDGTLEELEARVEEVADDLRRRLAALQNA